MSDYSKKLFQSWFVINGRSRRHNNWRKCLITQHFISRLSKIVVLFFIIIIIDWVGIGFESSLVWSSIFGTTFQNLLHPFRWKLDKFFEFRFLRTDFTSIIHAKHWLWINHKIKNCENVLEYRPHKYVMLFYSKREREKNNANQPQHVLQIFSMCHHSKKKIVGIERLKQSKLWFVWVISGCLINLPAF